MSLVNIETKHKIIRSWNLTYSQKVNIFYPSNTKDLKNIIKILKKTNKTFVIRTGECSYDSKSMPSDENCIVISLKKLNKIIEINKKNILSVESGVKISDLIYFLKKKNLTLYSVPGGEHVSIGGAISANVIGKDSSKLFAAFGDSVENLKIVSYSGKIKKLSNKSKEFYKFIGSFGMFGIILEAKIKTKKIISNNLLLTTKILKNIKEVDKELKKKDEYKYVQIDPFFRKNSFAAAFKANYIEEFKNNYKNINLKKNVLEVFFFKISSYFINSITWKIFYTIFFKLNKNKEKYIDLHNFHYASKYKHMVPLICRKSLVDYEIIIKKNFFKNFNDIQNFIKVNKILPIYIIVKKLFSSKKKSFYNFNQNGYSLAISFDSNNLKKLGKNKIYKFFKNKKLPLNLSKTDSLLIEKTKEMCSKDNEVFMSLYKKKIVNK